MNSSSDKSGFTLIEILVAIAIITTIISMVYGSYFATSKSAQACKIRMALSQQGRELLEQMAQQIRCCYAGSVKEYKYPAGEVSQQKGRVTENITSYFYGNSGDMGGEILAIVTTRGISEGQAVENGLFEVVYKFDKNRRTLFFSHERFLDVPQNVAEKRNWQILAGNIEGIELAFSDGQQWLQSWDFKEKGTLPYAVKVNITCEDENFRQYCYGTIAYVCCGKNQSRKTISETLVSINKP